MKPGVEPSVDFHLGKLSQNTDFLVYEVSVETKRNRLLTKWNFYET